MKVDQEITNELNLKNYHASIANQGDDLVEGELERLAKIHNVSELL